MHFGIVGAGFSGSILAYELAKRGHTITVCEERDHVGGNCYSERDSETGVMVHTYGPHIFHTDDSGVWNFICGLTEMRPFVNRVKAISGGRIFSLPINLLTINQFFGKTMDPGEARRFIADLADSTIVSPSNFEEQALAMLGIQLYEAFFLAYTKKQWGLNPTELPASILKRLPVRFNYDDNYFSHRYQGMPVDGYTPIFDKLLSADRISMRLNTRFEDVAFDFDHLFYSGPIDRYFNYRLGRLPYRTLDFERFVGDGDVQGCAVINYCDMSVPFTRITEHKHFAPWEAAQFPKSVCYREFSRACGTSDVPYYPIRQVNEKKLLSAYVELARGTENVSFIGRLGTYRYIDMDVTIAEALNASGQILSCVENGERIPSFFLDPLA